jgi:DNA-directed RNA polymerase specialized sigma24 family protein
MSYDGYELFQHAIMEHDDEAWTAIAARYRPLMIAWATRCPAMHAAGECCENLADQAFARAWMALTPERFAGFANLAALLAYLRACVKATVIDAARTHSAYDRAFQYSDDASEHADCVVIARLEREDLWQLVMSLTTTEAERVALRERFVYGHAPRAIQARHPALFSDVTVVYTAIRNLCDRLRRHKQLAEFYAEYLTE